VSVAGPILSIWAHPDDETYLAGGVMAAAVEAGTRVVCVSATAGEHGTPDPAAWPPDRLGRLRKWESAAAMAVLGVPDHRFLGFADGGMSAIDPSAGAGTVQALIEEIAPATILTFAPHGLTFHPDHIAISRWVTDAWCRTGCTARLLHAVPEASHQADFAEDYERWGVYMTDERPASVPADELALHLRLEGTALDRKLAALHAMASQTRPAVELMGDERYAEQARVEAFIEVAPS
jgi:LmbE family N-acetylglucosaminyl deacetylase